MTKGLWWLLLWFIFLVATIVLTSFFGWFIFLLGICILLALIFPIIYWGLAPENRWFTLVEEGTGKIIVRGKSYKKLIIRWDKHDVCKEVKLDPDDPKKIIHDIGDVIDISKENKPKLGGLVFYSFWYPLDDIGLHRFEWTGVNQKGEIEHHEEEWQDFVLLKEDVYYAKVIGAEDQNVLPLDIELVITARVINPQKAIFNIQNWLETVINRIKPVVTKVIANDTYENWIKIKNVAGDSIFNDDDMKKIREEEFLKRYGIEVRKIQIKDIIPPQALLDITLKKYTAQKEAEAVIVAAGAEKTRLETVAQGQAAKIIAEARGEAERINILYGKIREFGDTGQLVRTLEAMEKSPLAASVIVQAIPGLPQILSSVFGKKSETISQEEFQEVKEMLKKLVEEQKKTTK